MSSLDVFIRIVIAAGLGGIIGLEREIREHTAGFRTHILVSVGAAAFTVASIYGTEGTGFDPTRISAGIVTGMGFLGAGAIIRDGLTVRGLTTAASLWTVAAVGLLTGQGFWQAALITTGVVVVSLYLLRLVEDRFLYPLTGQPVDISVRFTCPGYAPLSRLTTRLGELHVAVKEMAVMPDDQEDTGIRLTLILPRRMKPDTLLASLTQLDEIRSAQLD